MVELEQVRDKVRPHETLLVADSLTGQDAVHLAKSFHDRIGISGIVLTRMDGDARGGAALRSPVSRSSWWAWAKRSISSKPSTRTG